MDDEQQAPHSRLEVILGLPLLPFVLAWDLFRALGRGIRHVLTAIAVGLTRLVAAVRAVAYLIIRAPLRWAVVALGALGRVLRLPFGWVTTAARALGRWTGIALRAFGHLLRATVLWLAVAVHAVGRWTGAALRAFGHLLRAPVRWTAAARRAVRGWAAWTLRVIGCVLLAPIRWTLARARSVGRALWTTLAWVGAPVGRVIRRLAGNVRRRRQRVAAASRRFARRVRAAVPRPRIRRRLSHQFAETASDGLDVGQAGAVRRAGSPDPHLTRLAEG